MPSASSAAAAFGRAIVMAWLISGRRSGKTASITTPWISSMRPMLRVSPPVACWGESVAVMASIVFGSPLSLRSLTGKGGPRPPS